jgi:hypothetical protein
MLLRLLFAEQVAEVEVVAEAEVEVVVVVGV